jgi:hypothetical protein
MGLGNQLSLAKRNEIVGARLNRVPFKTLSANLGVKISTAKYTMKMHNQRKNQADLHRSGRPRRTTRAQDDELYKETRQNSKKLVAAVAYEKSLSQTTIRERMKEIDNDYHKYKAIKTPKRAPATVAKRLSWVMLHRNDENLCWQQRWYSDEMSIEIGSGGRPVWVWRHKGEAWVPDFMNEEEPKGVTVMVWAGISAHGTTDLFFPRGDPDSERQGVSARTYVEMLEQALPECVMNGEEELIQDNCSVHTARYTRE